MRKTPSYFVRKMIRMQKLTTMSWLRERIRKNDKRTQNKYRQMYFRYESISDTEEQIKEEGILSGLTTTTTKNDTDMLEDHVWIVYEKKDPL